MRRRRNAASAGVIAAVARRRCVVKTLLPIMRFKNNARQTLQHAQPNAAAHTRNTTSSALLAARCALLPPTVISRCRRPRRPAAALKRPRHVFFFFRHRSRGYVIMKSALMILLPYVFFHTWRVRRVSRRAGAADRHAMKIAHPRTASRTDKTARYI